MPRGAEQRVRRGDLDQTSEIHHADTVRHVAHHREIVADEEIGEAEPVLQVAHQIEDLGLDRDVERRGRFVAHDERRLRGERPRDGDALALPAGELVRIFAAVGRIEPDEAQQLAHPGGGLRPARGKLKGADRLGDDVERPPARIETRVRILEHHLDAPAQPSAFRPAPPAVHRHGIDEDFAGRRRNEADHHLGDRRFAGPGLADQRQGLLAGDLERHVRDRDDDLAGQALQHPSEPGARHVEDAAQIFGSDEGRSGRDGHGGPASVAGFSLWADGAGW